MSQKQRIRDENSSEGTAERSPIFSITLLRSCSLLFDGPDMHLVFCPFIPQSGKENNFPGSCACNKGHYYFGSGSL